MRVTRLALGAAVVAAVAAQTSSVPHLEQPPPEPASHRALTVWSPPVPGPFAADDLRPGSVRPRPVVTKPVAAAKPASRKKATPKPKAPQDMPAKGTAQYELALAYRNAVAKAPKGCNVTVFHLAAIGQVESGSIGGRDVTKDKLVSPAIYGPLLDGGPFAVIRDTDGGAIDGDGSFDRAVGPLQFIPGTWEWAGADGDGDGRRDPQNVYDAALGTAIYLCRGGRDLSDSGDLRAAILSYNGSTEYLESVLGWVYYFTEHGLKSLDEVAFLVASGGRGSDLAEPPTPPKPPEPSVEKTDPTTGPTTRPTPTKTSSATPKPSPTKPRPSGTTTPTSPAPTTPAPTTPAPTNPEPTNPEPTPTLTQPPPPPATTTEPAPTSTEPPPTSAP